MRNPVAWTYIAVRNPESTTGENEEEERVAVTEEEELKRALENEWVGSAVLVGPSASVDDERVAAFDVYGLFVSPGARGLGLGRALIEACTAQARELAVAMGVEKVRVRVSVTRGNEGVVKLYERAGFAEDGEKREEGLGVEVRMLVRER